MDELMTERLKLPFKARPRRVRIYLRVNKPPKRPKGCQPYWCAYRAEWLPDDETVRNSA